VVRRGTLKTQEWRTWEDTARMETGKWKTRDKTAGVEKARVENLRRLQMKTRDWKMQEETAAAGTESQCFFSDRPC